ncbi:MAG: hypothetical protein ACJA13_001510 [Paraglaciecola sp.]|jgi:hypothetical protein
MDIDILMPVLGGFSLTLFILNEVDDELPLLARKGLPVVPPPMGYIKSSIK